MKLQVTSVGRVNVRKTENMDKKESTESLSRGAPPKNEIVTNNQALRFTTTKKGEKRGEAGKKKLPQESTGGVGAQQTRGI